jgi:tRNA U54 and U55 pseudouridine synthase Pus10
MRDDKEFYQATMDALARKTHAPVEVVRRLYDEELAELQSNSKVKNFIEVIAGRRVKERLNGSHLDYSGRTTPSLFIDGCAGHL